MNVLSLEDDDDEYEFAQALEAAIAFLNEETGVEDAIAAPSGAATCSTRTSASSASEPLPAPAPEPPKRCRKRNNVEIVHLRTEVVDLEARLAHLRRFCGAAVGDAAAKRTRLRGVAEAVGSEPTAASPTAVAVPATESEWFKKAVAEYKRLEQALQWNSALRSEVESQKTTSAALEQLFELKLSAQDLAFLARSDEQRKSADADAAVMELLLRLEAMYARTAEVLAAIGGVRDTRCAFDAAVNTTDPVFGRSFEFVVNTPLAHNFRSVERFVWSKLASNILHECASSSSHHRAQQLPLANCFQKHFQLELGPELGHRSVSGVVLVRKVAEPRRTVITLTGQFAFPGSALVVRQEGHIVVADAGGAQEGALMQTHFRIFAELLPGAERVPSDVTRVRDFVLSFVAETITAYQKRIQRVLLEAPRATGFTAQHARDLVLGCVPCKLQASSHPIAGFPSAQDRLP